MTFFLNCLLVFTVMFITDVLYALYFTSVRDNQAVMAATFGSSIYLLSALVTTKWIEDSWLLLPAVAGAWLGTFVVVRWK